MIFSIDTDILLQMSALANESSDKADRSVSLSNIIYEHNDWNCKERRSIFDRISSSKKELLELKEELTVFSQNLTTVSNEFTEMKNKWLSSIGNIDVFVASQVAVPTKVQTPNDSNINATISKIIKKNKPSSFSNYDACSLTDSIKVCDFKSIDFSVKK